MEKTKIKKTILIILLIVSLILPNISIAVEEVNDTVKSQVFNENTLTDENTISENDNLDNLEENLENIVENTVNSGLENTTNENTTTENVTVSNTVDNNIVENTNTIDNSANLANTTNTTLEKTESIQNTVLNEVKNTTVDISNIPETISLNENIATIQNEDVIEVEPGNGTLQYAIETARPGAIIKLKSGNYTGNDIKITQSITIKGNGKGSTYVYPQIIITDEDKERNVVNIEGISSYIQAPNKEFKYYDIQEPVDLNMKDVNVFHISRGFDTPETISINLSKNSSGTNLNIENSLFSTLYDGINIESSNNNITFSSTEISGRMALKLSNGSDNNITFKNNSKLSGRSSFVDNDEAISIVSQNNLEINIIDSIVQGNDARGNNPTHVFSFDGNNPSNNVAISITGNSTIKDLYAVPGSSIFNFGKSNTVENSNSIYIAKEVSITPNTVASKYNVDEDYAMVGIFDKEGNLTIKAYDMNKTIENEIKTRFPEYDESECTWYEQDQEKRIEFDIKNTPITKNMDLYPVFPLKIKVYVGEELYEITEGETLEKSFEKNPKLKETLENLKKQDKFKRFVDQDGEEIDFNTPILKETTIIPKYKVKVTVKGKDGDEELYLENGQLLDDLKDQLEKFEKLSNKQFAKYINIENEEEVTHNTFINEDIVIKPIYNVEVKINEKTYVLEEGKTLNDLKKEELEEINSLVKVENKEFSKFQDENSKDVDYTTPINENTTLTPMYNVKLTVTAENSDGSAEIKEYTFPENTTISKETIDEIKAFVKKELIGKKFVHFINDDGETIDIDTLITLSENMNLIAVYEEKIDIQIKVDTEETRTYTIETGANLNTLSENEIKEIKEFVKKNNKELLYFVEDGNESNIIDFSTSIPKNITLIPKYKIIVTVKPKYGDEQTFEMPEGKNLEYLKDSLEQFKNVKNKTFNGFFDLSNEEVGEAKQLNENITIIPHYKITITVQFRDGKVQKELDDIDEGSTLEQISDKLKEFTETTNKKFINFIEYEKNESIEAGYVFKENITIIPEYEITLTIKRKDESEKKFTIKEGIVLHGSEEIEEIREFVKIANKEFSDTFKNEDETIVDLYTILDKNMTLIPLYNVKITITKADGTIEEFIIPEGKSLSDIKEEDKFRFESTGIKENRKFLKFVEANTEEVVSLDEPINNNIQLIPKFTLKVTIGKNEYDLEEGKTLNDLFKQNPEVKDQLEDLKKIENKTFVNFVDQSGNIIEDITVFNENIVIIPKYNVKITVQKPDGTNEEIILEEGKTLNDLSKEDKEKLENIKNSHKEDEQFATFKDVKTDENISDNVQIFENITIKPIYEKKSIETTSGEIGTSVNNASNSSNANINNFYNTVIPKTSDNIIYYIALGFIASICFIITIYIEKKTK